MINIRRFWTLLLSVILISPAIAQISPGKLAAVHSHLEGMSNCTKCHELGDKVTNAKCLACHTELKARIDLNKGYHSSTEIRGKACITCHSDHHGEAFQILRFDKEKLNHALTGFTLTGAHLKKQCKDCHKAEFISNKAIKAKKLTYLGLNPACLSCHKDNHQGTLSSSCTNCHGADAFKPAVKFVHASTKFPLIGIHQTVPCVKCHPVVQKNGVNFQEFAGRKSDNCTNCHIDVHQNKFGQNCKQCHSETSFHTVKGVTNFDHSKTNFKLENKHLSVACVSCHKTSVTAKLNHDKCTDCHKDYHEKQFVTNGVVSDCAGCHTTKGFDQFSFTTDQHNQGKFKLTGAHLATPCFACHKKTTNWSFRQIGETCADCHTDIHKEQISPKYYPNSSCIVCHNNTRWSEVNFNHSETGFPLSGAHTGKSCRACHFKPGKDNIVSQQFSGLSSACSNCHKDNHFKQFDSNGTTDCLRCHTFDQWKIEKFDHNKTAFKLDGKHQNVACQKCHKSVPDNQNVYVLYKIKEWKCVNCH